MDHGDQCPFCQLVDNPEQTFDVHESEHFKAWLDINPRARGHTMIVPREHVGGMEDVPGGELFAVIQAVAAKARQALGAAGVSIVINDGEAAGQRLDHFYVQVFPRFDGEENEGAPAGAVFQPLEDASESDLEEWSSAMEAVEVGGEESIEGPATEMIDRKRGSNGGDDGDPANGEEDSTRTQEDDGSDRWDRDGAEFR